VEQENSSLYFFAEVRWTGLDRCQHIQDRFRWRHVRTRCE